MLEPHSIYANILLQYIDADQKHITSLRREKGYMPCAIESAPDIIREQRSKAT